MSNVSDGPNYSWSDPGLAAALSQAAGNNSASDAVTRSHLWDVPQLTVSIDTQIVPGMFYDSTNNIAGIGNTIIEVLTLPGVVVQRVTGIDSGQMATRRQYGGTWSSWLVINHV